MRSEVVDERANLSAATAAVDQNLSHALTVCANAFVLPLFVGKKKIKFSNEQRLAAASSETNLLYSLRLNA